jgi:hypothetical protein
MELICSAVFHLPKELTLTACPQSQQQQQQQQVSCNHHVVTAPGVRMLTHLHTACHTTFPAAL